MAPLFVLIHSPSVGPATWTPVAGELARRGHEALVPSLLTVGAGEPPAWPRVVTAVVDALAAVPPDRPVVLVPHSNAGIFIPVVRRARPPPRGAPGAPLHEVVAGAAAGDPLPPLSFAGPPGWAPPLVRSLEQLQAKGYPLQRPGQSSSALGPIGAPWAIWRLHRPHHRRSQSR